jgi:hypothetical protein
MSPKERFISEIKEQIAHLKSRRDSSAMADAFNNIKSKFGDMF